MAVLQQSASSQGICLVNGQNLLLWRMVIRPVATNAAFSTVAGLAHGDQNLSQLS